MRIKIDFKAGQKTLEYMQSDFDEVKEKEMEQANEGLRQVWQSLFEDLHAERKNCIWYYSGGGKLLYTLSRSTKREGHIQRSCFWLTGGEVIALSDQQYITVEDMRRADHIPDGITAYAC